MSQHSLYVAFNGFIFNPTLDIDISPTIFLLEFNPDTKDLLNVGCISYGNGLTPYNGGGPVGGSYGSDGFYYVSAWEAGLFRFDLSNFDLYIPPNILQTEQAGNWLTAPYVGHNTNPEPIWGDEKLILVDFQNDILNPSGIDHTVNESGLWVEGIHWSDHFNCLLVGGVNETNTAIQGILFIDTDGNIIRKISPMPTGGRGLDWHILAPDNHTIYYTSEDENIYIYDLDNPNTTASYISSGTPTIFSSLLMPGTSGSHYSIVTSSDGSKIISVGNYYDNGFFNFIDIVDNNGNHINRFSSDVIPVIDSTAFSCCIDPNNQYVYFPMYSGRSPTPFKIWRVNLSTGIGIEYENPYINISDIISLIRDMYNISSDISMGIADAIGSIGFGPPSSHGGWHVGYIT